MGIMADVHRTAWRLFRYLIRNYSGPSRYCHSEYPFGVAPHSLRLGILPPTERGTLPPTEWGTLEEKLCDEEFLSEIALEEYEIPGDTLYVLPIRIAILLQT